VYSSIQRREHSEPVDIAREIHAMDEATYKAFCDRMKEVRTYISQLNIPETDATPRHVEMNFQLELQRRRFNSFWTGAIIVSTILAVFALGSAVLGKTMELRDGHLVMFLVGALLSVSISLVAVIFWQVSHRQGE
jgi:hypothetical protein